jgi:hypothetical protein
MVDFSQALFILVHHTLTFVVVVKYNEGSLFLKIGPFIQILETIF